MKGEGITEGEQEELKEVVGIKKEYEEEKAVPIFFDGKQYSVRIPKKFTEALNINKDKDKFLFKLKIIPIETEEPKTSLEGVLIKNYEKETKL